MTVLRGMPNRHGIEEEKLKARLGHPPPFLLAWSSCADRGWVAFLFGFGGCHFAAATGEGRGASSRRSPRRPRSRSPLRCGGLRRVAACRRSGERRSAGGVPSPPSAAARSAPGGGGSW